MDLNGDGYNDVLSGSWPGELFLFEGGPNGAYAERRMLTDKDGEIINIGGGIREENDPFNPSGNMILIYGTAEFETTDEGTFAIYQGRRIESTAGTSIGITGTASTVHPADWDGDGDYDLIVGDINGNVYLIPNEGTATSYAFGKETQLQASGKPLTVGSRAGPYAADWDGDGDLDLIVGDEGGFVFLYRNTGTAKAPKLAAATRLMENGRISDDPQRVGQAERGTRAKVCVADWNGDGKPDLLVGDMVVVRPDLPEPTAQERAEYDRIRKELEPLRQRSNEIGSRLFSVPRVEDQAERQKLEEEMNALSQQISALQSKLPPEREQHGWVWLFLRK